MDDTKYVVMKREDFDTWAGELARECALLNVSGLRLVVRAMPAGLDDAVVIRTGDVFAASGLYAYGWNVATQVDLLGRLAAIEPAENTKAAMMAMAERLSATAGYFFERAMEAERNVEAGKTKVPD